METKQTDLWRQAQAKLSRHQGDWSALWDQITCWPGEILTHKLRTKTNKIQIVAFTVLSLEQLFSRIQPCLNLWIL